MTNLVIDNVKGRTRWKVNLAAIEQNLATLRGFPSVSASYLGPTHFIGGARSHYIP